MPESNMKRLFVMMMVAAVNAHGLGLYQPPEPLQWSTEPHSRQSDAVTMEVSPVEAAGVVEYRFECKTGGAPSSDWQRVPSYAITGLTPETEYAFVAQARSDSKVIGLPSKPITVKTRPADGDGLEAEVDDAIRKGQIECIPIMVNGDKDNRVNLIFANRWEKGRGNSYNRPEMREEYVKDCRNALKIFTAGDPDAMSPYPEYGNFLNLYGMWWADVPAEDNKNPEGSMKRPDYRRIRDRYFLPWQMPGRGWVTLIGFFNSDARGGNAVRTPELRIGDAMIVGNAPRGIIHEFSHTAPGCPDEYTSSGMWGFGGEGSTTTSDHRRKFCRWRAWIEPDTPVPTPYRQEYLGKVGLHEGGVHRMAHLYRPTARGCIMGAGSGSTGKDLCAVCRQRHVMRFYEWVNAIDARSPALDEITIPHACRMKFSVKRVHPEPDTQKTKWTLNGKVIATNADSVEVDFSALDRYELVFSLVDESRYIRADPPYADYPRASTAWTILNPKAVGNSQQMTAAIHSVMPRFEGVDNGSIAISGKGGKAPYSFHWADGDEGAERKGLPPRVYSVTVVDSEFRSITKQIDLTSPGQLDPRIVSDYDGETWRLRCPVAAQHPVEVEWNTGETTAAIEQKHDGEVACKLRHSTGCTTTRELTLKRPDKSLELAVGGLRASSGGENNGYAALKVEGGRKPMRFIWSDGVETRAPERHYLYAGQHSVTVRDANGTELTCQFTILSEPAFRVTGLELERQDGNYVRITNPDDSLEYLWFEKDLPGWLPRFPHGVYSGTYTSFSGKMCDAEAYVVQDKGGYYIKPPENARPHHRNDLGYWAHVMIYENGRKQEPRLLKLDLQEAPIGFTLSSAANSEEQVWTGTVIDGRMIGADTVTASGMFEMRYASRPEEIDEPICSGTHCLITNPGQYFIAARKKSNGAISQNRLGVAFGAKPDTSVDPVEPQAVTSANMLMRLDASDMDGDGNTDIPSKPPIRRGAVMQWQGKANDVHYTGSTFYYPNTLNGLGVASWKTVWVQGLKERPKGYQTIIMVRREHDLSAVGTAPWQKLSPLIGVGEYGGNLFSEESAKALENSRVFVDSKQVDQKTARMPEAFYVATYEFDKEIDTEIRTTEGRWEGEVAECLLFDGKLSDSDRGGVEEYLRRKWLSAVDLSFSDNAGK